MQRKITLSILDQSIVREGNTAADAIEETIATAKMADQLGYTRFWVSEHHNSVSIAGSAPELLMVKLADETREIRIGSGGIMLPNHSALKVAENFRMLETLFPGRIDLGMGRAPGTDRLTASLLNPSNTFSEENYLQQLTHLQHFFNDSAASSHGALLAVPQSPTVPLQWILSSSGGSAGIAAAYGMGLVVARFINGHAGYEVVKTYRDQFKPSKQFDAPRTMVAIWVLCAETDTKAAELRKLMDHRLLQFEKGNFDKPGDYASISDYQFTARELQQIQNNRGRIISGTPEQVKTQILQLADEVDVDEIMAVTLTASRAERKRSFELLAGAFELSERSFAAVGTVTAPAVIV